jgi:DNA helicase II / ATP-dependent DNA helicase PcrA
MARDLTEEQLRVVRHEGGHARVLAVAGSGKTTTLVQRCAYLRDERGVDPAVIRVLMFNVRAMEQFEGRLHEEGRPGLPTPEVSTFHAFAFGVYKEAKKHGFYVDAKALVGDEAEQVRWLARDAIESLERDRSIPLGSVDVEQALTAIALWKGALISPRTAGHRRSEHLPMVYRRFEELRTERRFITFDDFVPIAVELLKDVEQLRSLWCGKYEHLIVDEYQDVNYGQQRMLELLANGAAQMMVVGDDDQTLYEWRGARPSYILRDYSKRFPAYSWTTYELTRSFRFGPVIAQTAQNVIGHNTNRAPKSLIADDARQVSEVIVHQHSPGRETNAYGEAVERIIDYVQEDGVEPNEIWVLARSYAQLAAIEPQLLAKEVPYRVLDARPIFERTEVEKLFRYVDTASALDAVVDEEIVESFMSILNSPNRKITRAPVQSALEEAERTGRSLREALGRAVDDRGSLLYPGARDALRQLSDALGTLGEILREGARPALQFLVEEIEYFDHFRDYYGEGEHSNDRVTVVRQVIEYAGATGLNAIEFVEHGRAFDTTLGREESELITLSTIHKTKGLEFDYVFIPACYEGFMPLLIEETNATFDTSGVVAEPDPSLAIENERRLFYVGLSRARRAVHIVTSEYDPREQKQIPSRFLEEIELPRVEKVLRSVSEVSALPRAAEARARWARDVSESAGHRDLVENLRTYLEDLGAHEMRREVDDLVAGTPKAPFAYQHIYPSSSQGPNRVAAEKPNRRNWAGGRDRRR